MFQKKLIYGYLSLAVASLALFSFCDKNEDINNIVDACPSDYVVTHSDLFEANPSCSLVTHDPNNKCQEQETDITCDQKDQLTDSPQQPKSQLVKSMVKGSGGQLVPVRGKGVPAVTVTSGPNTLVQTLQHLLGFSIDLFSTSGGAKATVTCNPNLNFYAVEHLNATVAHEFPCGSPPFPRIQVATNPLQLAATPDSAEVWVTSYDNAITVINTNNDQVLATIAAGPNTFPNGIAISPDGTRVYVTSFIDYAAALVTYNRMTRTEIARVTIPTEYPQSVFLSPDGSTAIVTHPLDNIMWVVDTLSNAVIGGHPISQPYGVGFSPNGSKAYISSWPNSLVVMNMADLSIGSTYTVGNQPIDVVVSANGRWVITTNFGDGTVSELDTIKGTVTSVNVGGSPHGISVVN
jgi:YVTN family beta-propeller protein